jgi:hypothetical protein
MAASSGGGKKRGPSTRSGIAVGTTYGDAVEAMLRSIGDDPMPERVSDAFSTTDKEAYYDRVLDRVMNEVSSRKDEIQDADDDEREKFLRKVQHHSSRQQQQQDSQTAPVAAAAAASSSSAAAKTAATTTSSSTTAAASSVSKNVEIFDLQALNPDPDESLTDASGDGQELFDPFHTLPDEEFLKLSVTNYSEDIYACCRALDPDFDPHRWLPPTLEPRLSALRLGGSGRSTKLDQWKQALTGTVGRFIDVIWRTQCSRVQMVFFVRQDLFLILLLDPSPAQQQDAAAVSQVDLPYRLGAHFYTWSWRRLATLYERSNSSSSSDNSVSAVEPVSLSFTSIPK